MTASPSKPEAPETEPAHMSLTMWIIGIAILLGVVIAYNYSIYQKRQLTDDRPPNIRAIETDLEVIDQSGKKRLLSELRGKIWILSYIFTQCPSGCLGITAEVKKLQEGKFKDDPDLHYVSISVDPNHDTPEVLTKFAKDFEIGGDNWSFFTGDQEKIRKYMNEFFHFPVIERKDPEEIKFYGRWQHDMKLVLVDRRGMIRGYYDPLNVKYGDFHLEKLVNDIEFLKENEPMPYEEKK